MTDVKRIFNENNPDDDGFDYLRVSTCKQKDCKACMHNGQEWVCAHNINSPKEILNNKSDSKAKNISTKKEKNISNNNNSINNNIKSLLITRIKKTIDNYVDKTKEKGMIGGFKKNILEDKFWLDGLKMRTQDFLPKHKKLNKVTKIGKLSPQHHIVNNNTYKFNILQ